MHKTQMREQRVYSVHHIMQPTRADSLQHSDLTILGVDKPAHPLVRTWATLVGVVQTTRLYYFAITFRA